MGRNNRDDFPIKIKDILAKRVGYKCSNPSCQKPTSGPHSDPNKATNIGVAAHICAAAPGGPRYDSSMSSAERSSAENGIWLCQSCSTLIDKDEGKYSKKTLHEWKKQAEQAAEINQPSQNILAQSEELRTVQVDDSDDINFVGTFLTWSLEEGDPIENFDTQLSNYFKSFSCEKDKSNKLKPVWLGGKLRELGSKQFIQNFVERVERDIKSDFVTDYRRPSLALSNGKHFSLPILDGIKTLVFTLRINIPDYESLSAYNSFELAKTEVNEENQSICVNIDHLSPDGVRLLFLHVDTMNLKVFINNGILTGDEVIIAKDPLMVAYQRDTTDNKNLQLNASAYDTLSLELCREKDQYVKSDHEEWVITDIRVTPTVIIDPENAQPVLRQIFYDKTDQKTKARIKIQPDKPYLCFNAMIGNSNEACRPLTALEKGKYYRQGVFGFPKDIIKAAECFEEDGSAEALYQISQIFKLEPDFVSQELYYNYLQQAVVSKHEEAIVEMALNSIINRESNTTIKEIIEALEPNLSEEATIGWFVLGNLLEEIVPDRAFECYYIAAKNHYAPAVVRLKCSSSIDEDSDKALIHKAFNPKDYGLKQYCFGCAFYFGYDIEPRKKIGIRALEEAAGAGDLYSMKVLFDIFQDDKEFFSQEAALYWLERLAAEDSSYIVKLAYWYTEGHGCAICEENDRKAMNLLRRLIPEENSTAINNLAWMYENGRGSEVDYYEARCLYEKAADLGNINALAHLGKIYEEGLGVISDLNKAIEYYSVAAQKGNQNAKKKLEELSLS